MTLIEYIKTQISTESIVGDLAKDIQGDKEFPINKTEQEIISYLEFKTRRGGISNAFDELIEGYSSQKNKQTNEIDIDADFALLRTENWNFYKENFPVDKVILKGQHQDIYKVYCVDSGRKKALYFNIKSDYNLNDIQIVDQESIHIGHLTIHATIQEALDLLETCVYDTPIKPNEVNFKELLEFLKTKS